MIYELLAEGRDHARTGRELATVLNVNIRDITAAIKRERRQGRPICATSGSNPGYYLTTDPDELDLYCRKLKARATDIFTTRQALIKVLKQYQDQIQQ